MTRILIIDNNPDNRMVLDAILSRHFPHAEILEADSGEHGMQMARDCQPDLILLDYRMPGLDGPATCRILKETPATGHIPVLIITSERTDTEYMITALDAGADAFVIRPVEEAALVAQARAMLRLKSAEDARRRYQQNLEQMVAEKTCELNLRNEIARVCLSASGSDLYSRLITRILRIFGSTSGLFGYLDDSHLILVPAGAAASTAPDTSPTSSFRFDSADCPDILRRVTGGEPTLSNTPPSLPPGHMPIQRIMAVPVSYRKTVIGLIAVANKESDYTGDDLRRLAGVADYLAPMIHARLEQERANTQRDLLTAIVQQAAEGILVTDLDGTIRYVNPALCAITGYSEEEQLGKNPRIYKSGKQPPSFYEHLYRELGEGRPVSCTMINRRKDGSEYEENAIIFPVRNADGRIKAYAGIKRDMTHLRELEHQLQQSQKLEAVGRLTGGIAHDFNNLLTSMIGHAEMALTRTEADSPVHRHLAQIHDAARRAADLTGKLLAFSRRQAISPRLLDLGDHLRQLHNLLQPLTGERIALVLNTGGLSFPILADPAQLEQIILNLIVNATDALRTIPDHPEPRIEITLSHVEQPPATALAIDQPAPGGYAVLSVSDNGPGIPEHIRDQIFDPFFTTKAPGQGTGLGLSTVFGIISQNRAGILLTETPGGGATFNVYWPLAEPAADEYSPPVPGPEPARGTETILVVEDESAVREVTAGMLEGLGYTVHTAEHGRHALETLKAVGPVDLVITDVIMPVMDGPTLARELARRMPGLPVLFMSGHTDEQLLKEQFLDTSTSFLRKPFTITTLASLVRESFSTKGTQGQLD